MTLSQAIITDLAPVYFEGNASEDTTTLIENYFSENPEFAQQMRHEHLLKQSSLDSTSQDELHLLHKTQQLLTLRTYLFTACMIGLIGSLLFFTFYDMSQVTQDGLHIVYKLGMASPVIGLGGLIGYIALRYRLRTSGL